MKLLAPGSLQRKLTVASQVKVSSAAVRSRKTWYRGCWMIPKRSRASSRVRLFSAGLVCNATCGASCWDPAAEVNPLILIPSLTALGAVLGGIQGLGLTGWRPKLIWFAAGVGGGLLFGLFFHRTSTNYSYGDFLRRLIAVIAGGAYGAVVGVTAAYLRAAR